MNDRSARTHHPFRALMTAAFLLVLANGCALAPIAGTAGVAEVATGLYVMKNPDSVTRPAEAVGKSFEDITPEQEYYIGRAVTATVLNHYPPHADERANHYINVVGQTLAQASGRPETFGGYRFLILDSDEINAFAAPGGFIMITRGMVRQTRSEDELAAVLAHEIGHVEHRNGLRAIQRSRVLSALGIIASEGTKIATVGAISPLMEEFEKSVGEVVSTVVNNSYSREQERRADQSAIALLRRVGYAPGALTGVLRAMPEDRTNASPFSRTHPKLIERLRYLETDAGIAPSKAVSPARKKRFRRFTAGV